MPATVRYVGHVYTRNTAEMGPELRGAYVRECLATLRELEASGYHAADWALEAIESLLTDLARARSSVELLSQGIPVPSEVAPSALALLPPNPGRVYRSPRNPRLAHVMLEERAMESVAEGPRLVPREGLRPAP